MGVENLERCNVKVMISGLMLRYCLSEYVV